MKDVDRDVLLLRLRLAIANIEWITATANMESQYRDGWSADWYLKIETEQEEATWLVHKLGGWEPPSYDAEAR